MNKKLVAQAQKLASTATWQQSSPYQARTALGIRLMKLRAKIVSSGEPLLDWNGIEREVAERRGDNGRDVFFAGDDYRVNLVLPERLLACCRVCRTARRFSYFAEYRRAR